MFDQIEIVSVVIFTIEYSLRLWTIIESGQKAYQAPVMGRLRYAVSLTALIDFVSIATYYLYVTDVWVWVCVCRLLVSCDDAVV